jgi:all-trans-retinol 13,14-reductase
VSAARAQNIGHAIMKVFLAIQLAVAPFLAFWFLMAFATPATAVAAGLLSSAAWCTWRLYRHEITSLEIGGLAIFLIIGIAWLLAPGTFGANALWFSFAGLGLVCLLTVAFARPWTADYSRAAFPGVAGTPTFHAVNMALSGFWGAMFMVFALAHRLHVGPAIIAVIAASGAFVSIFGPKFVTRAVIWRQIRSKEKYRWRAPDFAAKGETDVDVAVVGAGMGGLTAAALLADAGLKVAIAEHHVVPGGFCHSFMRKAHYRGEPCLYRFDAGPHDFSGLWPGGPLDSVLRRLGLAERLEWLRLDHTYHMAGVRIDVPRDWHDYVHELGRLFPGSAAGFETLFADIRAIYDGMFATGRDHGGIPGLPATVDAVLAFPREHPVTFHWLQRPFDELVARHVHDPDARQVVAALTGYVSDGSETLTCADLVPLFSYYFHGGFYPAGGSGRLADVLTDAIKERGGQVWLKTGVAKIVVAQGRAAGVTLGDGRTVRARAVVSNADLKRTFLELVEARHLPPDFRAHIAAAQPAASAFMVHLGVDFVPDVRPALHVSGDPPIGVETLSRVDPTAAPPGHATIGIITLLPQAEAERWFPGQSANDWAGGWREWRRSPEYEERKTAVGDRMIAAAEKVIPDLSRHIVYRTDASPVTYARYDWTSAGAIYGMSRQGRLRGAKSPVPCLAIAGSATAGPGVEAAVISGALAADALVPGLLAGAIPPVRF